MGLLLAPFSNAMRLGQGFNSYTQEICIDDAVIVDPGRPDNPLSNDGTTMSDLRKLMQGEASYKPIEDAKKPSPLDEDPITGEVPSEDEESEPEGPPIKSLVTKRIAAPAKPAKTGESASSDHDTDEKDSPVLVDSSKAVESDDEEDVIEPDPEDKKHKKPKPDPEEEEDDGDKSEKGGEGEEEDEKPDPESEAEKKKRAAALAAQKAKDDKKKQLAIEEKERKEVEAEKEKRKAARERAQAEEEKRAANAEKRARDAASLGMWTKKERDGWNKDLIKEPTPPKGSGPDPRGGNRRDYIFNPHGARGPAQIVTYSSRFVDKLSEITDDMNISGALSIKYGAIGGSGRGAFVNSDKFHESDLNFYISVKVINQTTNLKDALVYQPLRSVDKNNFREVYGDCFISGFMEGGEFNALVSMKVLNKAQVTNIKAEAKVALTVGPAEITAEAAVDIAKRNISSNTETTVQVSWSGGGYIKPIDEPWDIPALLAAAARFPDLVARTPQRTYAILTKYDTLRSFVKLKPASFTPMAYETAQLYTNQLMDSYMDYKAALKKISNQIFDIENGISVFDVKASAKNNAKNAFKDDPKDVTNESPFPMSLAGLDKARKTARFQMIRISNEVDEITRDPSLGTDESRVEPFQPPRVFKDRLPKVVPLVAEPSTPLRMDLIMPGSSTDYGVLCPEKDALEDDERLKLTELVRERPTISRYYRLGRPVGSSVAGSQFNDLTFLSHSVHIVSAMVGIAKGIVCYIAVEYSNGLKCSHGNTQDVMDKFVLSDLDNEERIIGASIETGQEMDVGEADTKPPPQKGDTIDTAKARVRVTRLKLYTNRGRGLLAQDKGVNDKDLAVIDNRGPRRYRNLKLNHFDPIMEKSYIKGFWGYSDNSNLGTDAAGIWRLGVIWGNDLVPVVPQDAQEGTGKPSNPKKGSKK